jgi:hypothetical protein
MRRLGLRRLAQHPGLAGRDRHELREISDPPLSLIDHARRMFSRLSSVTGNSFHVIAQ